MRLKSRIRKASITTKQIAHAMKVHRVTVDAWINERRPIPEKQHKRLLQVVRRIEKAMEK